jgi:hypothetical protein
VNALRPTIAAMLACGLAPTHAAEWRFVPQLNTAVEYNDNPRLIADAQETVTGARAEAGAELGVSSEMSALTLVPRFVYARYPDDSLLDRQDKYVSLQLRRDYEQLSWTGAANYTRDTTITSEFGLTGLQDVNREHEALSVSLAPTWQYSELTQFGIQVYGIDTRYKDAQYTGLTDYTYALAAVSADHLLSETLTFGFRGSAGDLDVESTGVKSRNIDASLSLDWRFAEAWSARVSYGPTRVETELAEADGHIYAVSIARQNPRSTLRFGFEQDVTPTGRGVLVTREKVSFSNTYSLTPRTSWTFTGQAVRTTDAVEFAGVVPERDEFVSIQSRLQWMCTERWSLLLSLGSRYLSYRGRDADAEGLSVSIGWLWNGQPRLLSR